MPVQLAAPHLLKLVRGLLRCVVWLHQLSPRKKQNAQNWVGGAQTPDAAQQILAQGGNPTRLLLSGGKVTHLQMEHIWVEALINYVPTRGQLPTSSNPAHNTWIAMDASYKQHTYTQGMDIQNQVPLNPQGLLDAAKQGATLNEAQGWVQNLNQSNIQTQMDDYQTRVQNYIKQQNPNATVGDVIGTKTIKVINTPTLGSALPYTLTGSANTFAVLPNTLRHHFTYKIYLSEYDRNEYGIPVLEYTAPTASLAGKRLSLTYTPATQADADLIASYLPKEHTDGSPIKPEELPTGLPAYLIKLKPQLTLDGTVVATGDTLGMGQEIYAQGGFTRYTNLGDYDLTDDDTLLVGQPTAIGLSIQGISQAQLDTLKTRLEATKTKLQAKDATGLTGEQITGDILSANIWSWFAMVESHGSIAQRSSNILEYPALSYGLFLASVQHHAF